MCGIIKADYNAKWTWTCYKWSAQRTLQIEQHVHGAWQSLMGLRRLMYTKADSVRYIANAWSESLHLTLLPLVHDGDSSTPVYFSVDIIVIKQAALKSTLGGIW